MKMGNNNYSPNDTISLIENKNVQLDGRCKSGEMTRMSVVTLDIAKNQNSNMERNKCETLMSSFIMVLALNLAT